MTNVLLRGVRVDPARAGERVERLPFLVGENGSGKTTLLEAIAVRCGIRPGGGRSYAETEDDRAATAISAAGRRPPKGLVLRADRFAETMEHAGRLPMPLTGEWRMADEQSRGEGVLSLLAARVDASEGMLFILDEPETGLSPERQMMLLAMLDELHRDGRSQAIVATHSPILLSHPGSDRLWIGADGVHLRELDDIPHWRDMRRFMREPAAVLRRLIAPPASPAVSGDAKPANRARPRPVKLWVLSDLRLDAVPHHPPPACTGGSAGDPVAAWIHGHVQGTVDQARSDGTRMVCNAAGPGFLNSAFVDDCVVEV